MSSQVYIVERLSTDHRKFALFLPSGVVWVGNAARATRFSSIEEAERKILQSNVGRGKFLKVVELGVELALTTVFEGE